ncbi:ABC1 kinase family protein [Sagittula sp.]|uniref:ABC1 kinase family protein n=1 Tax=Sagittula sp. TaxID=2038081 RepID=UPI003518C95A
MDPKRPRAVPRSRFARAAGLGSLATGIAGSAALGAAGSMLRGERPDRRALLLTPGNVNRLTRELARMRGAAMKLGQLLSMENSDLLPPDLARVLARLRDDAHHMPPRQLKQVLMAEYGPDALKRFRQFDPRPRAAASIGQVHRVTAADGRDLALKIQYPGIAQAIRADVANLGTLLRASGLLPKTLDLAPLLAEATAQLEEEADYALEATRLVRFHDLLQDDPAFVVPRPHPDLSTPRILAMDFIESHPIDTLEDAEQAQRDTALTRLFTLFLRELFHWRLVQTDPNFANYRLTPDGSRIVLLDFGATRAFTPQSTARFRALLDATHRGDPDALRLALTDTGFITDTTPADQVNTILDMAALIRPVLTSGAPFDFGDTTLLNTLRRMGEHLTLTQGYAEVPHMDALHLQRKLAGLVLLATRMRARVPLGTLLDDHLP